MQEKIKIIEAEYMKKSLVDIKSGDYVKVHQVIKEGDKERVQIFEGTIIKTRRLNSISAAATIRRITGGFGVEKVIMLHSPNIKKIEIIKRSKVRRNFLSYYRKLKSKSTRLQNIEFDKEAANEDINNKENDIKESKKIDRQKKNIEIVESQESTENIVKEENKEANKDNSNEDNNPVENDENQAAAEETNIGIQKK